MRMNAETMKLHGIVFSTAQQLGDHATAETIALVSGYSEQQVRRTLINLEKQGVISMVGERVTELHGFHGERA